MKCVNCGVDIVALDASAWMHAPMLSDPPCCDDPAPAVDFADAAITVHRMTYAIPYSDEQLMDEGVIPDTRPPAPPVPWRLRARRKIRSAVAAGRMRIGSWIAGVDLNRECEC